MTAIPVLVRLNLLSVHEDAGRYQDKEIPRLAGQWPAYLFYQLIDYQSDQLKMPQPDKMRDRVRELSKKELEAVSRFYGQVDNDFPVDVSILHAGKFEPFSTLGVYR